MKPFVRSLIVIILLLPCFSYASKPKNVLDSTIPVVNLNDFYNSQTHSMFVSDVAKALQEYGFFAVINPDIDIKVLNQAYSESEKYFRQSLKTKMKDFDKNKSGQRGYVPSEVAKGQDVKDFKEFYHIGRELSKNQQRVYGYHTNIWPNNPKFKNAMQNLYTALSKHQLAIEQTFAEAIGVRKDFFSEMTRQGDSLMRALHYPANPPKNALWAAEHTDIDLFTILPKSSCEGLQVQTRDGKWISVNVPENAFIVNAGDFLQNITNGEFRSSVHRVAASKKGKERFSIVYFVHTMPFDNLSPLARSIERTGGIQKFPNANRNELLFERLTELGLATDKDIKFLAKSGLMDRQIKVGKASLKAMQVIEKKGLASKAVKQELNKYKKKV